MNPKALDIAPLLRGLSFDGEKGDIVVYHNSIENAELRCTAEELSGKFKNNLHLFSRPGKQF